MPVLFVCVANFVTARLANVVTLNFDTADAAFLLGKFFVVIIPNRLGVFFALPVICAHEACQYVQIYTYTCCWDFFFC